MKSAAETQPPRGPGVPWWSLALAGLLFGALTTLSLAPFDLWWLTVAAPMPLVVAGAFVGGRPNASPWRAGVWVWLGALPAWLFIQRWTMSIAPAGYPVMAAYCALYAGLFVTLLALWRRAASAGRLPIGHLGLVAPLLWTGLETLRGEWMLGGYAWYLTAHPLIELPVLAAPAAWLGTYFVSFLAVTCACGLCAIVLERSRSGATRSRAFAVALCLAWPAVTAVVATTRPVTPTRTWRVAVVQTNALSTDPGDGTMTPEVERFARMADDTLAAAKGGTTPGLIVWPESMFPGRALNAEAYAAEKRPIEGTDQPRLYPVRTESGERSISLTLFYDELLRLQREAAVPMLVGSTSIDNLRFVIEPDAQGKKWIKTRYDRRYNSAYLVENGAVSPDRYDKMELTPFGEYIPVAWRFPTLARWLTSFAVTGMSVDLTRGQTATVFPVPIAPAAGAAGAPAFGPAAAPPAPERFVRVVTPICFEATVPAHARAMVFGEDRGTLTRRADLMVNLTSDGWFGRYQGVRAQHMQIARWRTVELATPMLRAANTGISCLIDDRGVVVTAGPDGAASPELTAGVMTADVPLPLPGHAATPLFARVGNLFGWSVAALAGLGSLIALIPTRRRAA